MKPVKTENVVYRKVADEVLLIPICGDVADMKRIYVLNEVGDFIWEHIDGKRSIGDILDAILERYEVSREEAEGDLKDFIKTMAERNLIEVTG